MTGRRAEPALVLTGEAGIGKSTLLDAVSDLACAHGVRVLRARGTEHASGVDFGALDQLLAGCRADLARLRPAYRRALSVALGAADGAEPQRLVLTNATLELLGGFGRVPGTLVVVDDLQWLDGASAEVLAAVARRLAGSTVGFIGASRPVLPAVFATAGLGQHVLAPLGDVPAAALVRARYPSLSTTALRRVLVESQGNPLALLELPAGLTPDQVSGAQELPATLPVTPRLEAALAAGLPQLPEHTRDALLVAALECSGDLRVLSAATSRLGGVDQLAPAEAAGMVHVDAWSRTVAFSHPVLRSVVVQRSTGVQRRRAHRALAHALRDHPERRVWHLAQACPHPDDEVAALLDEVAAASLRRGETVGATSALVRASQLSGTRRGRARRLVDAAYVEAAVAGHVARAARLLEAARDIDPTASESLPGHVVRAIVTFSSGGDVAPVLQPLVRAIRSHGDRHAGDGVDDALHTIAQMCEYAGRPDLWALLDEMLDQVEDPPALLALRARPSSLRSHLEGVMPSLAADADPATVTRTAAAAVHLDRAGDLREPLKRVIRAGREGYAGALAISAVLSTCADGWLTGRWDEALELAEEGARLGREHGHRPAVGVLDGYVVPLILAARGHADALAAVDGSIGTVPVLAHHVRAIAAAGDGDFETAYRHATAISPPGVIVPGNPQARWLLLDVVESAIRTGRPAEAAAHVEAMHVHDLAALSSRLRLVVTGAAGMAARGDEATRLYEQALAVPGSERWPFDLGRITLCFGEHLRRQHQAVEARAGLRTAVELFEGLGAVPWVERAGDQLRATGVSRAASRPRPTARLTPQELEIAHLAAQGLSNKQIAERLYLSHRTVGACLYRVFPKLGITSRAGLRDALRGLSLKTAT